MLPGNKNEKNNQQNPAEPTPWPASARLALATSGISLWEWDVAEDRLTATSGLDLGTGAGRDALSLHDFLDSVHTDDRTRLGTAVDAALNGEGPARIEFRVRGPRGETRWLSVTGHPERNDAGKVRRLLGAAQDITGLVQTRERMLAQQRALLELAARPQASRQELARKAFNVP